MITLLSLWEYIFHTCIPFNCSTLPFLFCSLTGTCQYASRNDFTYWLAGDVQQPMMPISNVAIEPFISRCVVCQAPDINMAVHSQDVSLPDCPTGYESLWSGYSFMMVRYFLFLISLFSIFSSLLVNLFFTSFFHPTFAFLFLEILHLLYTEYHLRNVT